MCTQEGVIYDISSIVPFLKQYGKDPATGKKLDAKSLIKLNFTKNSDGKYHCPVLFKVFNENSHIVALKTSGNVFSYEAIEQLNIKAKNFKDLLDDSAFTRADIITVQDPGNLEKFNLKNMHHIRNNIKLKDPEEEKERASSRYTLKHMNNETRDILNTLDKSYKSPEVVEEKAKPVKDIFNSAHYSTGLASASFTSTAVQPSTKIEAAILDDDVVRYSRLKKKGYVQLQTNLGNLNLELFCEVVPKTCENFISLAAKGYYDGTIFHRSIRNFIVQGGDPTGTGTGGQSIWGEPFEDEFKVHLTHQGRGVLSMANAGPNTNKSQFFITFRSCRHLDNKHTVFGKIVGGLQTIQAIEDIETDNKDKPIEDIQLTKAVVFVNPFQEVDEELVKLRQQEAEKQVEEKKKQTKTRVELKAFTSGVGKYINPQLKKKVAAEAAQPSGEPPAKKKTTAGFGSFSSW